MQTTKARQSPENPAKHPVGNTTGITGSLIHFGSKKDQIPRLFRPAKGLPWVLKRAIDIQKQRI
jgi:hypothetical protein